MRKPIRHWLGMILSSTVLWKSNRLCISLPRFRTVENVVTRPEIKEILSIMAWLTRQWRKKGVGEPGDCSVRIRDQHLSSRQRDAYRLSVVHPEFLLTYANSCFEELKTSFVICNLDKNRQEPTVQSLISRYRHNH